MNQSISDSEAIDLQLHQVQLQRASCLNYSVWEYVLRLLWKLCWFTIWPLCWKRMYPLRPLLLRLFGAKLSLRNEFDGRTWVEIPWNLDMGEYCAVGFGVTLYNLGPLKIGDRTVISRGAFLCGGSHDYTRPTMPLVKAPVTIGCDVWICAEAFVGPGVIVGDGAVVGARAVVMRTVKPWSVVAGNPAHIIKKRTLYEEPVRPS